jgi:hypothetical protein
VSRRLRDRPTSRVRTNLGNAAASVVLARRLRKSARRLAASRLPSVSGIEPIAGRAGHLPQEIESC